MINIGVGVALGGALAANYCFREVKFRFTRSYLHPETDIAAID